jgi:hypothetical protein
LKQTILRLGKPLREKQIFLALRVDVWDTPPIPHDARRRGEARHFDRTGDLRDERRWRRRGLTARRRQDTERTENAEKKQPPRH